MDIRVCRAAETTEHAVLTPRKQPVQERSAATVDAILDGAARVLDRDGSDGFTTTAVARATGVSIGTLYQYFADKDELVAALSRRTRAALVARIADAAELACARTRTAADLAAGWRALLAAALIGDRERPRLARELDQLEAKLGLDLEGLAIDDAIAAHAARWLAFARPDLDAPARLALASELRAIGAALVDDALKRGKAIDEGLVSHVAQLQLLVVARAPLTGSRTAPW